MKKTIAVLLCVLMMAIAAGVNAGAAYAKAYESLVPENQETLEGETDSETTDAGDDAEDNSFTDMTTEELYEYLLTLETEEEIESVLGALTPEQLAALEVYAQSREEQDTQAGQEEPGSATPARNYTDAAPFGDPVDVQTLPTAMTFSAMQTLDASETEEEDALILDKTVSGADGSYTLTIEAYATGEVTITTGETPVPTDIILVLDVSRSMNNDMLSGHSSVSFSTNSEAYDATGSNIFVKVDGQYYAVTITRDMDSGFCRNIATHTAIRSDGVVHDHVCQAMMTRAMTRRRTGTFTILPR